MPELMLHCPATGAVVSTGIDVALQAFATVELHDNAFRCTACGQMHTWDKSDAFPDT